MAELAQENPRDKPAVLVRCILCNKNRIQTHSVVGNLETAHGAISKLPWPNQIRTKKGVTMALQSLKDLYIEAEPQLSAQGWT